MSVYKQVGPNLWEVGYYDGEKWVPESQHTSPDSAAERVEAMYRAGAAEADTSEIGSANEALCEIGKALVEAGILDPGEAGSPHKIAFGVKFLIGKVKREHEPSAH